MGAHTASHRQFSFDLSQSIRASWPTPIELAQLLDLLVVSEGVETPEQFEEMSLLRSDYAKASSWLGQ